MADIIQLLPDSIANQIAAGEVVQRPASVVKELLENSIDAGSTNIRLIVKEAGKILLQVIDNGSGMSETDARMCFERHATSKIRKAEDLFAIRTMGFRGEAMASIAAVAQVEMRTRRVSDELGTKLIIEGSETLAHESDQCPVGTSISVKNLFFNIPARRNFLKSNQVEMRHILDEFQRVVVAHPEVFFSLHHNSIELFHLPAGNLRQRLMGMFGQNLNKSIVPVQEETDVVKIEGFVGKPESAKKTRGEQLFFVNNRFIKSSYLQHAVMMAYEDLIPKEAFPFYALFLDIDPARIDVNVHPTKQEIKFDDEKLVYNYLKVAVRHALGQYSLTPTLDFEQETSLMPERQSKIEKQSDKVGDFTTFTSKANARNEDSTANSINYTNPTKLQGNNLRNWQKLYDGLDDIFESDKKTQNTDNQADNNQEENENIQEILHSKVDNLDDETTTIESSMWGQSKELDDAQGTFSSQQKEPYQIHSTYIVSQIKSGFMLIDQQSAHERILYEKYLALFDENRVATQAELFPKTVTVSPTDAILLVDILPEINQLGFDVQAFGQNTFVLHGIPSDMKGVFNEKEIVETLLEQYKQNTDLSLSIKENVARSMAKSAALKRGKTLNVREMRELIDRLFACAMPYQSPSGQNCFILYSLEDLMRQFAMG